MGQGNGFVGVVCVAYLIGGFILGGFALAIQTVIGQYVKQTWIKVMPLTAAMALWLTMLFNRFVGIDGAFGGTISGIYTAFGGWVYPYDLIAFAMSTVPILAGLIVGLVVCRGKKEGSQ